MKTLRDHFFLTKLIRAALPAMLFALLAVPVAVGARAIVSPTLHDVIKSGRAHGATVTREIPGKGTYLSLFLEGDVAEAELKSLGVIVNSHLPNGVMTAMVPLNSFRSLIALPGLTRVTAAYKAEQYNDVSVPATLATPNYWTSPPAFTGQAGANVIVGIVDSGIDWSRSDFKNSDGSTRILNIWDQLAGAGPPPSGFSYGKEWSQANINAGLPPKDTDGHGTHVAGSAVGNGSLTGNGQPAYQFVGMAPKADIIVVSTDFSTTGVADGVNYIFQRASALGKSAVVNLSLGTQFGAHDGTDVFDTAIDGLTGPGRVVVAAAGNEGGQSIHALQLVPPGGDQSVTITVPAYTPNGGLFDDVIYINGYYPGSANMSVTVTSPRGTSNVSAVIKGDYGLTDPGATDGEVYVENDVTPTPSGDTNIFINIYDADPSLPPRNGTWTITLTPVTTNSSTRLDLWLPDFTLGSAGARPLFSSDVDEHDLVGSPACASQVIAVGAYTSKFSWLSIDTNTYSFAGATPVGALAPYSSPGPLRNGTQRPDVTAPGTAIVSTLSSVISPPAQTKFINPDGVHWTMGGTSMACAHVSGGTALMLADRPSLTPAQVRAKLHADALADANTGAVPNDLWGYGKLQMIRPDTQAPVVTVSAPNGAESWAIGTSHNVTWTATDNVGVTSIAIDYSTDNGANWLSVTSGEANDGVYTWSVPNTPTVQARIRVTATDAAANSSSDASDGAFAITSPRITATAGPNGTISPNGVVTVGYGTDQAFTITPASHYHVADVLVDGSSAGAPTSYTFTNVTTDHTIAASFAINTYTLTYTAGANGTISGTSPQTVAHGGSGTEVTAVPNTGYHFVSWSDGVLTAARTDTNVTADISVTASFAIDTYTLTYTAGANGTISGTSPQTVNYGGSGTPVTAVPNTGYHFVSWSDGVLAAGRTDTNVTADISVTASFAINTYTLTYTAGANGTISGISPQTVAHGGSGTEVTAVPNAGYHFVSWSDGVLTAARTDTNVTADISVTASFTNNTYTLTYSAGANGTISGSTPQTVPYGGNGTPVTAVPDTGYHFVSWSDGVLTAARTDTNVTADISVTASFAINTYTLTYTAGVNGTISGTSPQTVAHGGSGTEVTAVPNTGYHFVSWSDGVLTAGRTDTNVTADISVTASFAINTYTLTYTAGANGTISGTSPQTVNYGGSGTPVTAVPDAGYQFVSWSDGVQTAARTDTNVTADISVTASFAINTYTLTYTAGANGTISGISPQTVAHGGSGTEVTAVPNAGYHFVSWSDGVLTAARTDTNVTADISVTASFAINTYTLTYTAGPNGTISGTSPQTVNYGGSGTLVTAVPNTGYHFVSWSDGVLTAARTDTNVTADISVTASFAINTYTLTYTASANGTISGTSPQTVDYGGSGTLVTAVPNTGYHFVSWSDGVLTAARTDTNVTADISVTASFAISTYTLTYTAGANGTISGTSPQTVNYGDNGTLVTAVPDAGYQFVSWSDGVQTAARTDTNVTADISVTASFAINTYTLTYTADANGTISGISPQTVAHGGSGTEVTAVPNAGYHFVSWSDGVLTAARTDTNVTADISVTASFAINTYTLTYTAGPNGTISGTSPQTVNYGGSGTLVTAVPNTGYHFVSWSDGVLTAARTDTDVTADISVTASFAINTYTLTYTASANGTISGTSPQTVNYGGSGTLVTAVSNTGYHFVSWSDGVLTAGRTDTNVTADISVTASFAINTYTLTYTAGANGTISGTSPQTVNYGGSGTLVTAVPDAGYQFVSWSDGVQTAARTDTNVTADILVTASFAINTYTLTYTAGANGTISGTSPQTVNYGGNGTPVTAVPNTGYHFVSWSDGVLTAARTDTNVTADISVTASFAINTYTLTYTAGANGTISGTSPQTVNYGGSGTLVTAVPNTGYHFVSWSDGVLTAGRTDTNVTADISVTASFAINTYTLTYTAGANGTISGTSPQTVNYGDSGTLVTAVPDAGYHFVSWSDGVLTAARTDTNVTADISVTASFAINTYTLTYTAGANGTISGSTPQTVPYGGNGTPVTAVPDTGYHFVSWSDGVLTAARTDTNVTADISVTASFAINTYTLTYTAGANGTISGTSPQTVNYGGNGTPVTAVPNTGYHFVSWSDGVLTAARTDTNVTADISVTASFAINTYTLTYTAGANGTISGSSPQTVNYGGSGTLVTAVPDAGYQFVSWSDGVQTAARTDTNVTADISVTASFAINTYTLTYTAGANGTISGTSPQTVPYGGNGATVTAVPNTGYHFVSWSDGVLTAARTDTNVTADISVTASFAINTYTLTYTAGANGTISGTSPQTVNYGGSGTLVTAVPNAGYQFVSWSDGVLTAARTDTNVTADISVTASFAINTYTLTYTAGANGTISGTSPQTVAHGGSGTEVTAVPNTGHHFVSWSDGVLTAARTDTNVTADISVTASFAINTYTLTYTAGANGTISGTSPQTVNYGGNGTPVTAVPNTGYHFVSWSDGVLTAARTDTNVTADISVTASFAINTYTLTYTAGANGTISGTSPQTVNYGGNGTPVTAVPNTGYHFVSWSDGVLTAARTDTNVTADISVTASFAINTYTLTYTADANGTISGTSPQTVPYGGSGTPVTAVPNIGYHFVSWSDGVLTAARTDTNVTADISVTASFAINTYTLTYTAGANGTISGTSPQTVNYGGSGTLVTAVPDAGYQFVSWSDGVQTAARTDTNVTADISVTASFAINTYTLTYTAGANGTISGSTPQTVPYGGSGTLVTAVPNTGYHFVSWSDGVLTAARTDTNVTADISVTASFAINTYTLTYTAGANGTISGTSPQTVPYGGNGTPVTAVPNTGYHFVSWSDGVLTAARTDTNVAADISVTASFAINTYTLTYTAGANGTISGTSPQTVNYGGSGTLVTAVPDAGYQFVSWSDGVQTAARTDTNVTADILVTASFAINTYTLTYTAGANGTISGISPQTVAHGGSGTEVTAVPNTGYHFVSWSDGVLTAGRTDTNVTADISVTASFAIDTYTLTYTAGVNGTISGTSPQTVNYGDSGTLVTAVPDAGYHFVSWSDGVLTAARTDTNVTADISVTASFAINTYTLTYTAGANGTISGTSPQTVNYGGSGTAVTAVPNIGYHFVSWSDGVLTAARTDTNVTADISVTASFAINTYTLTYTAGANGTISGTSPQTVPYGGSGSPVTAVPNTGYHFVSWSDGVLTAARTDTNVTADISVTASFAINTYTLTYTAGANGTISGSSPQTVNYGGSGTLVTAVPDAGYQFVSWSDGVQTAARTDTNVTANISVTASFAINTYTLTYTAGANGTISGTSPQTVAHGGSGTEVTAVPNTGYHFVSWSDGVLTAARTDTNVTADISVTASFAINQFTLTVTTDGSGSVAKNPDQPVYDLGTIVTLTATAADGWYFVGWSGDATGSTNPTTVTMDGPKSVLATFAVVVAPVTHLAATQEQTGNGPGATTRIELTWDATPSGTSVEVWRASFGHYPEYDDAGGQVPAPPTTYPPGAGWTMTSITTSGEFDESTTRDSYYYVAFAKDTHGTYSTSSSMTVGTLNYHLGDVSDGHTAGNGNNKVQGEDISLLGSHYGLEGSAVDPYNYLDVGPTTTHFTDGRPLTDNKIDFEDLVMFALNFGQVGRQLVRPPASDLDELVLNVPSSVSAGDLIEARVHLRGTGVIHGLSIALGWNRTVLEVLGVDAGELADANGGIVLTPSDGVIDAAVLGGNNDGFMGDGDLAIVRFRAIADGATGVLVESVGARDSGNNAILVPVLPPANADNPVIPEITELLPPAPNPFNPQTRFQLRLATGGDISLAVFAADGRRVRALYSGLKAAGEYWLAWDGRDDDGHPVGSGVYFVRLLSAGSQLIRRVTLLK